MFISTRRAAASMIAAIWIGLILGVSFYAASIKFTAPGVGREQLLSIGQVTFQGLTWIELAAFVLLLLTSWSQLTRGVIKSISMLCLLLLVQKVIVQPILDTAINQTIAGESVDTTVLHFIYGGIDCVKLVVLFLLSLLLRAGGDARQTPEPNST
jgi:hypothetical protein